MKIETALDNQHLPLYHIIGITENGGKYYWDGEKWYIRQYDGIYGDGNPIALTEAQQADLSQALESKRIQIEYIPRSQFNGLRRLIMRKIEEAE